MVGLSGPRLLHVFGYFIAEFCVRPVGCGEPTANAGCTYPTPVVFLYLICLSFGLVLVCLCVLPGLGTMRTLGSYQLLVGR